jgi:predicted transposase YbfD/YdcC
MPSSFNAVLGHGCRGCERLGGQVIAIDGKTLRGSYDRTSNKAAMQMVSAWAQANRVVPGQVKTEVKSNEITAIPHLLKFLDIQGCIVTIDAMGCQKAIAEQIIAAKGDYVLALKGNQETLYEEVKDYFAYAEQRHFQGISIVTTKRWMPIQGRIERHRYWTTDQLEWLEVRADWAGLRIIGMVEAERHVGDQVSVERRYSLGSLTSDAQGFAQAVCGHWSIESAPQAHRRKVHEALTNCA